MTDKEKAEEYVKTNHSHIMSGTMKSIYKKIYLAGLAEARKEYSEIPCTSCCITESLESDLADLNYQLVNLSANAKELEKENAELKAQIEKIKLESDKQLKIVHKQLESLLKYAKDKEIIKSWFYNGSYSWELAE